MKIALALFPNSKMGGILTVHKNLILGLKKLGHAVTDYYMSQNLRSIAPCNDQTGKEKYCGGRGLGIRSQFLKATISELSKFDVVIYSHPVPSQNRSFQDREWMNIFHTLHKTGVKQIVVWHDPFWKNYYPWVVEVCEDIDLVACIQKKAYDHLPEQLVDKAFICNHPLDLRGISEHSTVKENLIISPHQFKSWKRIDLLVRAAPIISATKCRLEHYNGRTEYYFMSGSLAKRKEKYKNKQGQWIWDEAVKAGMTYHGVVSHTEIVNAFRRQKCVVDLSVGELGTKKGLEYKSVNYSILECMKHGGIPVVRHYSVMPPFNEDSFLIVDEEGLVESTAEQSIRAVQHWDTFQKLRARNRTILRTHYSADKVSRSILERL